MPDIVRANVRYCLNVVRLLCCCLGIVLSVRTRGKVNSCNDIQYMLMLKHCQNAARHILIVSYFIFVSVFFDVPRAVSQIQFLNK